MFKENIAFQAIKPFLIVQYVLGTGKFHLRPQSKTKPILRLIYSSFILVTLTILVQLSSENSSLVLNRTFGYLRSVTEYLTPIQYFIVSSLTYFLRRDDSEDLFRNLNKIIDKGVNLNRHRKINAALSIAILVEFTIHMIVSTFTLGLWATTGFTYAYLANVFEGFEIMLFYALVQILADEVGVVRKRVDRYAKRPFVLSGVRGNISNYVAVYGKIARSYRLVVKLFSPQILISAYSSFIYCLIVVQLAIDAQPFVGYNYHRILLAYWFFRNLARMVIVSAACGRFQHQTNQLKRTLINVIVDADDDIAEQAMELLSVVHGLDAPTTIYNLFCIDKLPFKLLSLLATYTIVLVQFAHF